MIRTATMRRVPGTRRAVRPVVTHRRRMGQIPGVGAAVELASAAVNTWMNSIQLSHDADTATTLIVNGLAAQLQNLLNAYLAEPATCASQRAALDAYDQAWQWLQSPAACGAPAYGSAGNRCISDRAPGGPTPWHVYYRDPIANDPRLAGQNCDTSAEVILPSLSTGTYAPSGITAGGALDTTVTGSPAPGGSAASPVSSIPPVASPSATIPGLQASPAISPTLLYAGIAAIVLGFVLK
jgi:hypothetical protein